MGRELNEETREVNLGKKGNATDKFEEIERQIEGVFNEGIKLRHKKVSFIVPARNF